MAELRARLQGGPFDGEKLLFQNFDKAPEAVWVKRCPDCGLHIYDWRIDMATKYRLDAEATEDGWLVYVFTDDALIGYSRSLGEKVTA